MGAARTIVFSIGLCMVLMVSGLAGAPDRAASEDSLRLRRLNSRTVLVSGGPQDVNITAFSTEAGIVVVDTGESATEGQAIRRLIQEAFPGKEFAYIINTHSHWDHISGNTAYPGVKIVAHQKCRDSIEKKRGRQEMESVDADVPRSETDQVTDGSDGALPPPPPPAGTIWLEGESYDLTVPDITFTDSMSLYCGDTTFRLYYFGETHTVSDILVLVPEADILLAGDLFFHEWLPVFSRWIYPDTGRWASVRQALLDGKPLFTTVVPGHGPLMDRAELEKQFDYRLRLWEAVSESVRAGKNQAEVFQILSMENLFADLAPANIKDSRGRTVHDENIRAILELMKNDAERQ